MELLRGDRQGAALAITRAQARKMGVEQAEVAAREQVSGVQPSSVEDNGEGGEVLSNTPAGMEVDEESIPGMSFAEELFVAGRERPRQSRGQKRRERWKHAAKAQEGHSHALDLTAKELQELQQVDETLVEVRKAAEGGSSTAGTGFFYQDGVIYRRCNYIVQPLQSLVIMYA